MEKLCASKNIKKGTLLPVDDCFSTCLLKLNSVSKITFIVNISLSTFLYTLNHVSTSKTRKHKLFQKKAAALGEKYCAFANHYIVFLYLKSVRVMEIRAVTCFENIFILLC